ncbi:MAG: hypothetical protein U1C55_07815 [Smithellaceae bacterium]|nr:hypothetical protein [Smithellaceae bacterium]
MMSRAIFFALLILWVILTGFARPAGAQDTGLPESGIRYPGGFDLNTVGEIQGRAFGFVFPESGPVRFQVAFLKETYIVLTSPAAFWHDLKGELKEGGEVRVLGSKTLGADGRLYLIAQEVRIPERDIIVNFRTEKGSPLWLQSGVRSGKSPGSSGSFPRGGSGIGKGVGGAGKGRR